MQLHRQAARAYHKLLRSWAGPIVTDCIVVEGAQKNPPRNQAGGKIAHNGISQVSLSPPLR